MFATAQTNPRPRIRPLIFAAALLAMQLLAIGLVFKHGINFYCLDYWPAAACGGASRALAGIYCAAAAIGLFALLRRNLFADLLSDTGRDLRPLALNALGFALTFVPVLFLRETAEARSMVLPSFAFWVGGMALMLAGLALYLAPAARWGRFLRAAGPALPVAAIAGMLTPPLAMKLQPIWHLDTVADITFRAVVAIVGGFGYPITPEPETKILWGENFAISIAPVCSGVEGIALVTLFVTLYLWLFRAEIRFPHALILYPLGILASAILNVVRIAVLMMIGLEGQPELAAGGFHSHAGWIMFTLIALGIIGVARNIPWLRKDYGTVTADAAPRQFVAPPPLRHDPQAARILPFAVFMLTAVVVPAITQSPAMFYPARVLLLAAAVALFWPFIRSLDWRISPLALAVGAAVGIGWVMVPVEPAEVAPYGALTGGALVLWYLFRGIGTVLLVPLVEELFFRDYLESRIRGSAPDQPAPLWRVLVAALITAALFAALHDRWVEALIAGLAFSWVTRRSGRISDAILAHAVANLIVFAVAAITGNLAII
ncbi:MAG: exosortase E/protease, VPEID-CTERM system [Paracoccus sp. (in: a-proteobacteria)]|uniref:exosortase E/protease, VPEID-CTERM system n=1 Tax=Paracoccus sp. TaxID=267 RepID=UPI0026E0FADF|nr:exosortase E/protease, VPEID-CTERM system [Paracoccus sp. (in: a-proteobacteria)]MDO5612967.1 exosortase E/protease, VPEID-CTERM system [Paracoccus sp. (in: a-proteobacteria)]